MTRHTHTTRDIKAYGECPACDRYHEQVEPDLVLPPCPERNTDMTDKTYQAGVVAEAVREYVGDGDGADKEILAAYEQQIRAQALEKGDGYHTHEELYEYRMLYNAHAARGWLAAGIPVVKSWRHSDGELCFGGGWFVVYADLPAGQVSNHYKAEFWGLFDVPEVDLAPEYDGHTPAEAAERLRADLIWQGASRE